MKKTLPLVIGTVVGLFAVMEFYIPAAGVRDMKTLLEGWALVLAAAAFVLGAVNIIQVNVPKIQRREQDWQYKIVLLGSAAIMALAGVAWHTFGGQRDSGTVSMSVADRPGDQAFVQVVPQDDLSLITVTGHKPMSASEWRKLPNWELAVPAGKEIVVDVRMPSHIAGYETYTQRLLLEPGQTAVVHTDLVLLWGKNGRVHTWMYDHIFDPCNSTMFALLAFFIASAAFRAFRARNTEAALLLGSAILVMVGVAPMGSTFSDWLGAISGGFLDNIFPNLADWILEIPNTAGRRAIMMGAALAGVVTGLRVILGLERSHLGSD